MLKDIYINVIANVVVGVMGFLVGLFIAKVKSRYIENNFNSFFGIKKTSDIKIVYGNFYAKNYNELIKENKANVVKVNYENEIIYETRLNKITGTTELRSVAYINQEFGTVKKSSLDLWNDLDAFKEPEQSFILIGGPITNLITRQYLESDANTFFEFKIEGKKGYAKLFDKRTKEILQVEESKDLGIILSLKNTIEPNKRIFICAGIRSDGSSSATYYLMKNWKSLLKEFKDEDFGILVETSRGSDKSVKKIREYSKENNA